MTESLKFTEMLCARFTHDIIGPVGALNNGAEFLRDELAGKNSMAAELIESSAKEAVARVQYYRQAYGYLPANAASSIDEFKDLVDKFFAASKIKIQWENTGNTISSLQKKLLLNILLLATGVLIRGGIFKINIDGSNITVTASGDKASLHENYKKTLLGQMAEADIDSRLIQIYYTYLIAKENSCTINISESLEQVVFSFKA